MPTDLDKLKVVLRKKTDAELIEIREALGEIIAQRDRDRTYRNRYMVKGTRVRTIKRGNKLPKGVEGVLVEAKRTRCVVDFDDKGRYRLPLDFLEAVE